MKITNKVVKLLNTLLEEDAAVINKLLLKRQDIKRDSGLYNNTNIAFHVTDDNKLSLGALGVINGIMTVLDEPRIRIIYNEDGSINKFIRQPKSKDKYYIWKHQDKSTIKIPDGIKPGTVDDVKITDEWWLDRRKRVKEATAKLLAEFKNNNE